MSKLNMDRIDMQICSHLAYLKYPYCAKQINKVLTWNYCSANTRTISNPYKAPSLHSNKQFIRYNIVLFSWQEEFYTCLQWNLVLSGYQTNK